MKTATALIPALLLLAGAGSTQAQVQNVESRLTLSLVFNVSQPAGTNDDERIAKVRFSTKDFISFADAAVTGDPVRSVVLRRATTLADTVANTDYLTETLVLLDAEREVVPSLGAITQTAMPITALAHQTGFVGANQIKEDAAGELVTSRKDLFLNGSAWLLDANGDLDLPPDDSDQILLDLIGLVTASAKRRDGDTGDAGLFLSGWSAPISGGVHVDDDVTPLGGDLDGVLTGTIRVGAEKSLGPVL